jgi:D-alanyl-D-alanine carboxypeptidase/D-alanyl-D-alanine-endopeptidase (penicillin-binding protein 4)
VLLLALTLLQSPLDQVLDTPKLVGAVAAAYVAREDGAVLYERNSASRVTPASNQKLLSCAFALNRLEATPATKFWREQETIFVETGGNPMLTHDQLVQAARRLGRARVVKVKQLYRPGFHGDWELGDLPNKYAAAVTAFTVDRGSFELWAENGRAFYLPRNYGARIVRRRKTGARKVSYDPMAGTAYVDGELPKARTRLDTLALPQPDRNAASLFGSRFEPTSTVPVRLPDLVLPGATLPETLKECLVKSDNNLAEQLLLMAASRTGELTDDPYALATKELAAFLTGVVGLLPGDLRSSDGSGLSRHNIVTARAIGQLLVWALRQPTSDVWLGSLATAGSGPLASRLKDIEISAKTGTLDMASALSGYVRNAKGERIVFSIILNNYACTAAEARQIQDEFVKTLIQSSAFGTTLAAS